MRHERRSLVNCAPSDGETAFARDTATSVSTKNEVDFTFGGFPLRRLRNLDPDSALLSESFQISIRAAAHVSFVFCRFVVSSVSARRDGLRFD